MSSKDSWHAPPPPPPPQSEQPPPQQQQQQQQPSGGPPPSSQQQQQQQQHRPPHPYTSGPGQSQPPVLPPPSIASGGSGFFNPTAHPLSLPTLSASSHPSYSLPAMQPVLSGPPPPGSSSGPQQQQRDPQQAPPVGPPSLPQPQQPSQQHQQQQQQGPPPPQHQRPGPPSNSPGQPPLGMQTSASPPLVNQLPLLNSPQGPHPDQQQQQQQQQQQRQQLQGSGGPGAHPLSSIPNPQSQQQQNSQPQQATQSQQHQPGMNSVVGQAQSQVQHAAASQMPPSAAGPGSGPGGPILNVGGPLPVVFIPPVPFASPPFGSSSVAAHDVDRRRMSSSFALQGAHGQLNVKDALSYLDQVKFQFQDQPDVYNKFLDIMKDFKSQAIDTPGVIDRVSSLFSGHPSLIQGFNTFLPPGYRIECSQDPRDTKITVTTPSGIHHASSGGEVSIGGGGSGMSLTSAALGAAGGGPGQSAHSRFYEVQGSRWSIDNGMYGPYNTGGGPGTQQQQPHPGQQPHPSSQSEPLSADALHQQRLAQVHAQEQLRQRQIHASVTQLQSAAAQTNGATIKMPTGLVVPQGPGTPSGVVGDAKTGKGPVEFNHAISYVNKIKNRFAQQPEIYKQFLEILQTYQRESKPIQDVYSQVTELFKTAQDLLEDFKQFLPESAAQARAAAAAKAAADEAASYPNSGLGPPGSGPGGAQTRLPPVGNFAPPPSVGKETKGKKRLGLAAQQEQKTDVAAAAGNVQGGRGGPKRHKTGINKPSVAEQLAAVSPTLIPFQPEPFGPPPQPMASTEELAFFDRVKKFIGNKQTYNEFLKLLNLFSQDLIGKDMLVDKVANFIGGNKELMDWFKRFVSWEGRDEVIDNVPRCLNKVRLSVCRGLGPSYRLLPKLEAQKPCSGRDEMCWEVLNDQWASHPTWASEDSGFVAHKKNQFEDILHRIEEERHDYDFNIEANLRTIQLLEPIAQRIAGMTPEEKASYKLQPGLGGQSKTIYQRIIKKVYDKEKGLEVIEMLHNNPVATVPIVLKRLKSKDEEWKAAQREWQKVWRDQTARVFWKSLDHQGITVKSNDKKQFTIKSLVNEIQAKHREQINKRVSATTPIPEFQFQYSFADFGIILDASRLLAVSLEHNNIFSLNDREKIDGFIKSFIPLFFGMNSRDVEDTVNSIARKTPDDDPDEAHSPAAGEGTSTRSGRRGQRQDQDLLRDVLKRGKNGKSSRKDKEGSVVSRGSKESTPEIGLADPDVEMNVDGPTDRPIKEEGNWIARPLKHLPDMKPGTPTSHADEPMLPIKRNIYTLYCNTTIYGFFRTFQILCNRLADVKASEADIKKDIEIRKHHKVANELNITNQRIEDLFAETGPNANYYSQVLDMCEKFIEGDIDTNTFEEGLRSVYVQRGWSLYTIDKLLLAILKFIQTIVPNDTKEKNPEKEKNADIILRFQKDRERREFTKEKGEYQELIAYRRNVESMLGPDDNVYRIDWQEDTKEATVRFVPRNEVTVNNDLDKDERWNYYIQTYMMVSPTEGIPLDKCKKVFLRRNHPSEEDLPESTGSPREVASNAMADGACNEENMEVRICVNTYRLFFMQNTEDFIVRTRRERMAMGQEQLERVWEKRKRRWREKVLGDTPWMKGMEKEAIEEERALWERFLKEGNHGAKDVDMGGV